MFGRTRQQKRLDGRGCVRRRTVELPLEQWSVCIPEHHPGYVSWGEYLATRERLRANVIRPGEAGGAAREGGALLQGDRALRPLWPADAGRLFGHERPRPTLCLRARPPPARQRSLLPLPADERQAVDALLRQRRCVTASRNALAIAFSSRWPPTAALREVHHERALGGGLGLEVEVL